MDKSKNNSDEESFVDQADKKIEEFFPNGKAKYTRTKLQLPKVTVNKEGQKTVIPADMSNQLLTRIEGGPEKFVDEQKRNFGKNSIMPDLEYVRDSSGERLKDKNGYYLTTPESEKARNRWWDSQGTSIDFDKRNEPVILDTKSNEDGAAFNHQDRTIRGLNDIEKNPSGTTENVLESSTSTYLPKLMALLGLDTKELNAKDAAYARYHGFPAQMSNDNVDTLGHELNHAYTSRTLPITESRAFGTPYTKGKSYITNKGNEYSQAATAGLNAMRDVTGEKLNDPASVRQLLDEVKNKPAVLQQISPEHGRIFRTIRNLEKSNPEDAERLKKQLSEDSRFLTGIRNQNQANKDNA